MKKILFFVLACSFTSIVFAQTVSVKNDLVLYPAVWELMLNVNGTYKAVVTKADVADDVYVLAVTSVQKILVGSMESRYNAEYSFTPSGDGKRVICKVTNLQTRSSTGSWKAAIGQSSMTKLADTLSLRATNVLANEADYASYKEKVITDPAFLYSMAKDSPSALWTAKFLENNQLIGKATGIKIVISAIEENSRKDLYDRAYVVRGVVEVGERKGDDLVLPITVPVRFFTNDDNVITLLTRQYNFQ